MHRILIVEDDLMIADLIETLLASEGYEVIGVARTVTQAVELCRLRKPEYAIIDLRLADGGIGTEVVGELGGLNGLGVIYASDNASGVPLTSAHGIGFVSKPYRPRDLLRALAIVIDINTDGHSALAHPTGFRVLRPSPVAGAILA